MKRIACLIGLVLGVSAHAQDISYFNQGFLRQPSAAADRAYLGVSSGTGGSVTNFQSGNFSPLFTTAVGAHPTFFPSLTFSPVSQAQNLMYASPDGAPGNPSFRALVTADLPDISAIVRGDVSATAPILYNAGTGVFSMHVADSTHDGYLSSADWITFNGKGSGTVTSITNASQPLIGNSLIQTFVGPVPTIKSISAGGNVTITDNGGTNLTISAANSGSGASGVDLSQTLMPAYDGATNFYLDFNWPAQVLSATGAIYFNYSTNWGLANTSRVARVMVSPTNFARNIYFINAATNWHKMSPVIASVPTGYGARFYAQLFGPGETNVTFTAEYDTTLMTSNSTAAFNPTNIGGLVLWLDASKGVWQDDQATVPAIENTEVRSWTDLSGTQGKMTNNSANGTFIRWRSPQTAPGNLPSVNFTPGMGWLSSPTFSALAQPNWVFVMFYGKSAWGIIDGSINNRMNCAPSQGTANVTAMFAGSSLTANPALHVGWELFAFDFNSTSSAIRTNGVQAAAGNAGTQAPNVFEVGAPDFSLGNTPDNKYVAELIVYHTNLSSIQVTNIENYFRAKYSAW